MPDLPDHLGHFGQYGGAFVPDTLFPAIEDLNKAYQSIVNDEEFKKEFNSLLRDYVGRPSPLTYAKNLSKEKNCSIYLKREDLNHTGAHKINNTLGQILLAKRMGKTRIIAETGAGQHGVATATVAALMGLTCIVYMGEEDTKRQSLNVKRMKLLGAEVISVTHGSRTLKDATTEAIRDWMCNVESTYYIIGSVLGPHPYPKIVRDFQKIIGEESKKQILEKTGRLPDTIIACVGGGSNAIGIFYDFLKDDSVSLIAVEAAGKGVDTPYHAASLTKGKIGVFHGSKNKILQTKEGQIEEVHSISAGLDYPGVSPELCHYTDNGRIQFSSATDEESIEACKWVSRLEGIIPALESAHAFAYLKRNSFSPEQTIIVNVSGRGDKDMETLSQYV
jgi:tryptophan synthase beta chain